MQKNVVPLVSVVIPCFNHGLFIDDTIDSVLAQTYSNIEIVIVDDGSTDDLTRHKLANYQKPNTRVIHQENKKTSAARNTGFAYADGDFILTIDADDLIAPNFVEKAIYILQRYPNVGAVSSWVVCFGEQNYVWLPSGGGVENFIEDINCPAGAVIRSQIWKQNGGYDEQLTIGYEDWDFWLNTTSKGWSIHIISEYLYFYRQSMHSRSKDAYTDRIRILNYLKIKYKLLFIDAGLGL